MPPAPLEVLNSGPESCSAYGNWQPVGAVREVEFPNKLQLIERHTAPTARRESSVKGSYGTLIEKGVMGGPSRLARRRCTARQPSSTRSEPASLIARRIIACRIHLLYLPTRATDVITAMAAEEKR